MNGNLASATLSSIGRSIWQLDRMYSSWFAFKQTGRVQAPASGQYSESIETTSDGAALEHRVNGRSMRTLKRDDLPKFLTPTAMDQVTRAEAEMQDLLREWEAITTRRDGITRTQLKRLNEVSVGIGTHILRITSLLDKLGFELDDHYERMRLIAAS